MECVSCECNRKDTVLFWQFPICAIRFSFLFLLISSWNLWWPWDYVSIWPYFFSVFCACPTSYPPIFFKRRWSVADEAGGLKRRLTAVCSDYSLSWLQILLAHHGAVGQRQLVCRAARSLHGLEKTWESRGENTEILSAWFRQSKIHWTA